jgi:hypothetical protein
MVEVPVIPAGEQSVNRRIEVQALPQAKIQDHIWKITKAKEAGEVAQSGRVPA